MRPADARAEDLQRHLRELKRLDGVLIVDGGELMICGGASPDPVAAASWLVGERLPSGPALARALGATDVVRVSPRRLGAWVRSAQMVARAGDLDELIEEGARPLRAWRGRDPRARVAWAEGRVALLASLARQVGAAPEHRLGLRLRALVDDDDALEAAARAARAGQDLPDGLANGLRAAHAAGVRGIAAWTYAALGDGLLDLAALQLAGAAGVLRAVDRARVVFGDAAARRILAALAPRPAVDPSAGALESRIARLRAVTRGEPPHGPAERRLHKALGLLPAEPQARAHRLVQLVLDWLKAEHRPVGRRGLVRRAARASGLSEAVDAVVDAWRVDEDPPPSPSGDATVARIALAILGAPKPPAELPEDLITALPEVVAGLDPDRLVAVWPVVVDRIADRLDRRHLSAAVRAASPGTLARAVAEGVSLERVVALGAERDVARYVAARVALREAGAPAAILEADWLVTYARGRSGGEALLALLARRDEAPLASVAALARVVGTDVGRRVEAVLATWSEPAAATPAHEELAAALEVGPEVLAEYAHHRRLAGLGEDVPASLLEVLELEARAAAERAWLQGRAEPALLARAARLADPAHVAVLRAKAAQRGRSQLRAGLEQVRSLSLRAVLAAAARELLGVGELPDGAWDAMLLLRAERVDPALVRSFLADVLSGRLLDERPANLAWQRRAEARGVDVARWSRGFEATLDLGGRPVTVRTERDPLHVLRMGVYFDTCLSLQDGFNAASTLVNALDANKQVLYARRADGAVVGRKLIGLTADGRLVGYRTYTHEEAADLRGQLSEALRAWASEGGLALADEGQPEVLHPAFWYDDGNEPWGTDVAVPQPGDPPDRWGREELALARDAARGDLDALERWVSGPVRSDEALLALAALGPERVARASRSVGGVARPVLGLLGHWAWVDTAADDDDALHSVLEVMADPGAVGAAARALRTLADRFARRSRRACLPYLPTSAAALTTEALLGACEDLWRLQRGSQNEAQAADVAAWSLAMGRPLGLAWLRDRDERPFARVLRDRKHPLLGAALAVAAEAPMPGVAAALRARLEDHPLAALALGTCGLAADTERLRARLEATPGDLALAVALARTSPQGAEAARELWHPPPDVPGLLADPSQRALARELRSDRLLWRVVRAIRRTIAEEHPRNQVLEQLLEPLARLGHPDGAPAALLGEAEAAGGWLGRDMARRLARLWRASVAVPPPGRAFRAHELSPAAELAARAFDPAVGRALTWAVAAREPGWTDHLDAALRVAEHEPARAAARQLVEGLELLARPDLDGPRRARIAALRARVPGGGDAVIPGVGLLDEAERSVVAGACADLVEHGVPATALAALLRQEPGFAAFLRAWIQQWPVAGLQFLDRAAEVAPPQLLAPHLAVLEEVRPGLLADAVVATLDQPLWVSAALTRHLGTVTVPGLPEPERDRVRADLAARWEGRDDDRLRWLRPLLATGVVGG